MSAVAPAAAAPAAPAGGDEKLARMRAAMAQADGGRGVHAFIVPSEDPHMSEYPPECDARRAYISGFDGSAGTAVVCTDAALLWTDGRYFLQAGAQLGSEWTLMRHGTPTCPEVHDWLAEHLHEGARVGIDPFAHTIEAAEKLRRRLRAASMSLVPLEPNPVDAVWGVERPSPADAPLRVHAMEWAGQSVADKLAGLRQQLAEAGAGALLVTMLDEVAWLFNLRGGDVPYNPVFVSYGVVTAEGATLYVDLAKVTPEAAAHLAEAGVATKEYSALLGDVKAMAAAGTKLWMDPARVSYALKQAALAAAAEAANGSSSRKRARGANGAPAAAAPSGSEGEAAPACVILEKSSPVTLAKSVKNAAELAGLREAHLRDGAALARFLCWLDKTIASGKTLTEVEIDEHLTARRAAQPGFVEPSFPTIAGAGPNGAIIHYRAQPGTCRSVDASSLLLLDSGAQYDCGTTDITRTMHFGQPSEHQRACFTRVLQGHIGLDTVVWPEGTPGCAIDVLARVPLWSMGLNYRHGTGHGVGAALNVHEGPQSISSRFWNTQPLLEHMVCSNEPGYYEDGAFGIRIENLFVVVEANTEFRFGGQSFYGCDAITLCPIQKKMINKELLSKKEFEWLNAYHARVWASISPRLQGEEEELAWLREATSPL
ncbi:putative Xaa-Pro aminopeptidase P [Micractinium conductrix]|uniref:Xaa-Pro aminopeptidase P n=1 Tax=Micractinium conductrix TaxID=554055 RepID=A0A2P6V769_9CHLO|nr:putative Xaa-Pro aminopeptidase P [Micractinium conductrix]|eukprot:PSC69930.1 putative Xaa-Pro aminopeptidase P [Micractinium conductrix]